MELSKKKIYEKVKADKGLVWCFDVSKANEKAFKDYQKENQPNLKNVGWKNKVVRKIIKYIKPDNLYTPLLSNCYEVREGDKYFGIPYGYFWRAVMVGYLLKLIKFIVKSTKE